MNFETTYRRTKDRAKQLMKQGNIPAYIQALQDLRDLQYLRAMGMRLQKVSASRPA